MLVESGIGRGAQIAAGPLRVGSRQPPPSASGRLEVAGARAADWSPLPGGRLPRVVGCYRLADMTNENPYGPPMHVDRSAVRPKRRRMTIREAYIVFVVTLSMIFLLSPAIDAARQTKQRPPIYPMISAIVPSGPFGILVATSCAAILAGGLTYAVSRLNRALPPGRVLFATLVFLIPLFAAWVICGLRGR